jgi:hypothetical protein
MTHKGVHDVGEMKAGPPIAKCKHCGGSSMRREVVKVCHAPRGGQSLPCAERGSQSGVVPVPLNRL